MTIRILTLFNKPGLAQEAIRSVEAQIRRADVLHVIEPDSYRSWDGKYPPAVFYNIKALEAGPGDYISWLSDDDLLLPNYVSVLAGFLDSHPEVECVYGASRHVQVHASFGERFIRNLPEEWPLPVLNADYTPGWKIDGGQFMIRRSALERVPYPYYPESADPSVARVCDALFMNKIVQYMAMHPVQAFVMVNRMTAYGSHVAVDAQGVATVRDWRKGA